MSVTTTATKPVADNISQLEPVLPTPAPLLGSTQTAMEHSPRESKPTSRRLDDETEEDTVEDPPSADLLSQGSQRRVAFGGDNTNTIVEHDETWGSDAEPEVPMWKHMRRDSAPPSEEGNLSRAQTDDFVSSQSPSRREEIQGDPAIYGTRLLVPMRGIRRTRSTGSYSDSNSATRRSLTTTSIGVQCMLPALERDGTIQLMQQIQQETEDELELLEQKLRKALGERDLYRAASETVTRALEAISVEKKLWHAREIELTRKVQSLTQELETERKARNAAATLDKVMEAISAMEGKVLDRLPPHGGILSGSVTAAPSLSGSIGPFVVHERRQTRSFLESSDGDLGGSGTFGPGATLPLPRVPSPPPAVGLRTPPEAVVTVPVAPPPAVLQVLPAPLNPAVLPQGPTGGVIPSTPPKPHNATLGQHLASTTTQIKETLESLRHQTTTQQQEILLLMKVMRREQQKMFSSALPPTGGSISGVKLTRRGRQGGTNRDSTSTDEGSHGHTREFTPLHGEGKELPPSTQLGADSNPNPTLLTTHPRKLSNTQLQIDEVLEPSSSEWSTSDSDPENPKRALPHPVQRKGSSFLVPQTVPSSNVPVGGSGLATRQLSITVSPPSASTSGSAFEPETAPASATVSFSA